jgi:hypothetical protein
MRAFLLILDVLGSMLVATLLFSVSGGAGSKDQPSICSVEPDFWTDLGRLFAIAVMASIGAAIPLAILTSLHNRSFKFVPYEGSPEWKQQLLNWRVQDAMIWIVGSAYGFFALNFILLFFANVDPVDQMDWIIASAITGLEDFILLPLVLSLFFPSIAMIALAIFVCRQSINGITRQEVIQRSKLQRKEAESAKAEVVDDEVADITVNNASFPYGRTGSGPIVFELNPNIDIRCNTSCPSCQVSGV